MWSSWIFGGFALSIALLQQESGWNGPSVAGHTDNPQCGHSGREEGPSPGDQHLLEDAQSFGQAKRHRDKLKVSLLASMESKKACWREAMTSLVDFTWNFCTWRKTFRHFRSQMGWTLPLAFATVRKLKEKPLNLSCVGIGTITARARRCWLKIPQPLRGREQVQGGNIVIIDNNRYVSMCQKILSNTSWYRKIPRNLIDKFQKDFYELVDLSYLKWNANQKSMGICSYHLSTGHHFLCPS